MNETSRPIAVAAAEAAPRTKPSNYPQPFAALVATRVKRPLGELFGLQNFGVNLTTLPPGGVSAVHHRHTRQDEFVFVVSGELVLVTDGAEAVLTPGFCAGFPAGGTAHHLVNRSGSDAVYLEIGDRTAGDEVVYPEDDLAAVWSPDGRLTFTRKDGTPYP